MLSLSASGVQDLLSPQAAEAFLSPASALLEVADAGAEHASGGAQVARKESWPFSASLWLGFLEPRAPRAPPIEGGSDTAP